MRYATARGFARYMLREDRLPLRPELSLIRSFAGIAVEAVLYREGCWQVELVTLLPGAVVPRHRHSRVDSYDLALGGSGLVNVGERIAAQGHRGSLAANLVHIPRGVWHEGHADHHGAVYLSFQHWLGGAGLISEDWQTWQ